MVLSADLVSIMKNEGYFYDRGRTIDRAAEIRRFHENRDIKSGKVAPKTDRGIKLGMTEAQVTRILGNPAKRIWSKRFEARELIYSRYKAFKKTPGRDVGLGDGISWKNYYLFRNGRLYYIEFSQDLIGGA